jgi:hypothetical protein
MNKFLLFSLVFIFGIEFLVLSAFAPVREVDENSIVDLWYTQAPFGVIYADVSGHFVWGSGTLTTSPSEAYSAKYWKDGQLQSLVLDATETPIVVDGSFKLTISTPHQFNLYGLELGTGEPTYILHLPYLPENVSVGMLAPKGET